MKINELVYDSPRVEVSHIAYEGVLCQSVPGSNESYGGDPDEDDGIF